MSFSLAGLLGISSPSLATDLAGSGTVDRSAIIASAVTGINITTPRIVPAVATTVPAVQMIQSLPGDTQAPDTASTDTATYQTLADAVAAQDTVADDTLRCLAGAVYFESKGEPLSGQLAVAQVIINRSKSGRFPADVCGVVKQRGQFSFVRGGEIPVIDNGRAAYRTAIAVAKVALANSWASAAPKALFFNTPRIAPAARLVKVASIGNHIFYR